MEQITAWKSHGKIFENEKEAVDFDQRMHFTSELNRLITSDTVKVKQKLLLYNFITEYADDLERILKSRK
jgi:dsDNA-binding SOS-regulon protein